MVFTFTQLQRVLIFQKVIGRQNTEALSEHQ
jgi:hypothetical protein